MKFEVGKKYTGAGAVEGFIYECVFETKMCYLMRYRAGRELYEILWNKSLPFEGFKEYHEPVKTWFNKYRDKDTGKVYLEGDSTWIRGISCKVGFSTKEFAEQQRHANSINRFMEYLGPVEIEF
jgi:hypothetical protein